MNSDLNILILAAGLGTRMKSNLAKVLHKLDGRPLINHVCETAAELAPKKVVVIVGHQAENVKSAVLAENSEEKTAFSVQEKQLGTGDAVGSARSILENDDSTLLVLSGDVPMITAETLSGLLAEHASANAACTILSVILDDPSGYGRVLRTEDNGFDRIVEQKDANEDQRKIGEINSGIYCFDTRKLYAALKRVGNENAQGEYYLTDVPKILSEDGEKISIYVCGDPSEVEGVNDRRQLAAMEEELRNRTIRKLMLESGVSFIDPKSAYISAKASIGRDTVISHNVSIEGKTVIGENCTIRPGVRIVDSTIGSNVEIKDNSFITDSTVGDSCSVGPMAHLRGHAVMVEGSKVGNFVELKKTTLGKGSKASHLTYLGDATIGEKTNIGAGTITCNYDGKNKHATVIGDGVKIGSDTMLIAPVKVGDRAVTGAGSVVTKDIDPESLVAGVPAKPLRSKGTANGEGGQRQSAEQVSSEESLLRMKNFAQREDQFVAAVEKSQN
jgi:bifunctional UDP-N-acetylglucosamine pyrophosphorylase/glucosamine-1-phosphate N-acetyltransferase